LLNHLYTRVECTVHLTFYLSLRRHYPDQVYVGQWSVVNGHWFLLNLTHHSLFTTHNNGFDLSLSFSLIAQSKAPLENYRANIELMELTSTICRILLIFDRVKVD
jgi:hypothetical protein